MFMLLRGEIHPGLLVGGIFRYSHPTAARQRAAKEAWMSIKPRHRIAARLRFLLNVKEYVWAARGARGR
jgi:hypothetical protein